MKKILVIALVLSLLFTMVAFPTNAANAETGKYELSQLLDKGYSYTKFTTKNTKIQGRTNPKDPFTVTWANSGVEFNFTGTSVGFEATTTKTQPFFYEIDGVVKTVKIQGGTNTYLLENNLEDGEHTIRILRNYDVWDPDTTFTGAITDKGTTITKTPDRDLKIQFIGDSITAGAGLESYSDDYAYICANLLNADMQTFAASSAYLYDFMLNDGTRVSAHRETPHGIGFVAPHVYSGIDAVQTNGRYVIDDDDFTFTFDTSDASVNAYAPVGEYDYNSFVPDIIVINLGTNDFRFLTHETANKNVEYNKKGFVQSYVNFLTTLGEHYPNTKIVCAYGLLYCAPTMMELINQAVEEYNKKPNHVETYAFTQTEKFDNATDGSHPGVESNLYGAKELALFLNDKFNLGVDLSLIAEEILPYVPEKYNSSFVNGMSKSATFKTLIPHENSTKINTPPFIKRNLDGSVIMMIMKKSALDINYRSTLNAPRVCTFRAETLESISMKRETRRWAFAFDV